MNFTPPSDPTRAQMRQSRVGHRLAQAIAEGTLALAYQPEVDLQSLEIISLEALCRWHDAELGPVAPDEFIAVAEARGLIVDIGQFLLQRVLADLPTLLARFPRIRVAINASGIELAQPDFAERFRATLAVGDLKRAQHLELEVTESVFHHNVPVVLANLQALQALGITIAIDDFGTGQSSLARLHTLPFDKIKLDRSFVQALDNPMAQAIVKAMADLAQGFSRALVVEGIETAVQRQRCLDLGCKVGQGYGLCRPQALGDLPVQLTPQG